MPLVLTAESHDFSGLLRAIDKGAELPNFIGGCVRQIAKYVVELKSDIFDFFNDIIGQRKFDIFDTIRQTSVPRKSLVFSIKSTSQYLKDAFLYRNAVCKADAVLGL